MSRLSHKMVKPHLYLVTYRERWWCGSELIDECLPVFLGTKKQALAWCRANDNFSAEPCWFWVIFRMEINNGDLIDEDLSIYRPKTMRLSKVFPMPALSVRHGAR